MADRNLTSSDGTRPAEPGYDHPWFAWSPLPARAPVRWPRGAAVAVSVVLDLGAVEWEHTQPAVRPVGGRGHAAPPDFPRMSHREFGHRVGVFRLLRILGELGIRPAAVVDVLTAEHYEPLLSHLVPAVGEVLAGGLSASRPITSAMAPDEERHYVATTLDRLDAALGMRPVGWRGPEHGESPRTPGLLAEAGLRYVVDWGNDDLPYRVDGAGGDLWGFPLSWELSDVSALHLRDVAPSVYGRSLVEAFDALCEDAGATGRVLGLHLHPWLSGQAFRAEAVAAALGHIRGSERAWIATPFEIVEWCEKEG